MYGYGDGDIELQYWKYLGTQINFMTFYYIEIETKLKRNWNEIETNYSTLLYDDQKRLDFLIIKYNTSIF